MGGRARSERVKKQKLSHAKDERMNAAILEWERQRQDHGGGVDDQQRSLRDIADSHGVSKSTLARRVQGGQSIREFNATKQLLSTAEEAVLVQFIIESADRGFPLNHDLIKFYVNAIIASRAGADADMCGKKWVFGFLDRHHDVLQSHWSKPLDTQRAKCLNPEAVRSWFDIVEKFVVELGILPENLYAMDENGFPPGLLGRGRVIGARGTKIQHQQGSANRENVTALVTICADGTSVKPMIIFKGKNFMEKWNTDNIAQA
jgi:hypothetical protein